ncbi:MAG: ABC transporter substrate-binding protein, partial [Fimbriiglobus sp.]
GWDALRQTVSDRLTEVRVARLRQATADRDWSVVRANGGRLAELYRANPKVLEVVFAARLAEAEDALKPERPGDLERVRLLLADYEARFPQSTDDTPRRLRAALADRAKKMFADAERLALTNPTEAKNLLKLVESLDPDLTGLREKQQELKAGYAVLTVGTRRLPDRMSPTTARFDSEKQAVELVFEGLLEAVPDDAAGVRFRPALAADRPLVGSGIRDVPLVGSAAWAGPEKGAADLADLADTVKLLKSRPWLWAADPVEWLDDPAADPADPGRVRLRFRQGHPDPRELLTFKVLPGRWLTAAGKQADDIEFARKPFGTGPFRLATGFRPAAPGAAPRDVVFVANPGYSRRPGKIGLPFIREVRFTDLESLGDLPTAFTKERVHVLTDVPTADLPKFTASNGLNGKVRVATAATNRRIHILAVNHRRPGLHSADLRRGLTHAIDREQILTDVFRAGLSDFHKPLTGPFPPGAWAVPKLGAGPLFDRDLAAAKLKAYRSNGGGAELGLTFPADDPLARSASAEIKKAVDATDSGFTLVLEPLSPSEFYRRVQDEHRFDLAYLPFDYPDDWFPLGLGSFLDPAAAEPGGRNYLGYRTPGGAPATADGQLGEVLGRARLTRDPSRLTPLAHEAHKRFNETVPFVPLWQLDRHTVMATAVKVIFDGQPEDVGPRRLDPTTLFTSIGRWRME